MTDDRDMEIEALKAIYGDDFEELEDPISHRPQYRVRLIPNPGQENNHVGLTFQFIYSTDYPSEPPPFELVELENISDAQKEKIAFLINAAAKETLGMPMVFSLTQTCKNWLDDNNLDPQEVEKLRKQKQEEETAKRRAAGTPVTPHTFAAWQEKFYARKLAEEKQREMERRKRPSGRMLFESNAELASSDAQIVDAEGGGETVEVDWSVFSKALELEEKLPED